MFLRAIGLSQPPVFGVYSLRIQTALFCQLRVSIEVVTKMKKILKRLKFGL